MQTVNVTLNVCRVQHCVYANIWRRIAHRQQQNQTGWKIVSSNYMWNSIIFSLVQFRHSEKNAEKRSLCVYVRSLVYVCRVERRVSLSFFLVGGLIFEQINDEEKMCITGCYRRTQKRTCRQNSFQSDLTTPPFLLFPHTCHTFFFRLVARMCVCLIYITLQHIYCIRNSSFSGMPISRFALFVCK